MDTSTLAPAEGHVIFDRESLEQFAAAIPAFTRRGAPPVRVALHTLPERAALERALNRGLRARGFLEGGVAAVVALLTMVVLHLAGRPLGWRTLAADLGLALGAAVGGKLLGMARGALMRIHAVAVMRRALRRGLPLRPGNERVAASRYQAAKAA